MGPAALRGELTISCRSALAILAQAHPFVSDGEINVNRRSHEIPQSSGLYVHHHADQQASMMVNLALVPSRS